MSYGIGHRRSSDPVLLWLWRRLAAVTPIRPLAWESPYAVGVALKSKKKEKERKVLYNPCNNVFMQHLKFFIKSAKVCVYTYE